MVKTKWLKKEIDGIIMAAQEQALRTRNIRKAIDKEKISGMCRMCGEREETVAHIVSECKKLAQNEYKNWRHDKVAAIIHWELCKMYGVVVKEKWYDHKTEKVTETDEIKILWDTRIQKDKVIENSRPDIVVLNKITRKCVLIDIAYPFDTRINKKEQNKIEIYGDLRNGIKRIWKCREVVIVPVIVEALGIISKKFEK